MAVDQTTQRLKQELIENYADCCMEALRQQGVSVGDGGKFYEQLQDLISDCMTIGELRI